MIRTLIAVLVLGVVAVLRLALLVIFYSSAFLAFWTMMAVVALEQGIVPLLLRIRS